MSEQTLRGHQVGAVRKLQAAARLLAEARELFGPGAILHSSFMHTTLGALAEDAAAAATWTTAEVGEVPDWLAGELGEIFYLVAKLDFARLRELADGKGIFRGEAELLVRLRHLLMYGRPALVGNLTAAGGAR